MTQLPVKTSQNQLPSGGFTITQAAQKLGLHPKTLRRWEQAGKFIPQRTLGNQRRYTQKDLLQLQAIKTNQIQLQPQTLLLSAEQAAQKLHVSPHTIRRWTKQKQLKLSLDNQLRQGYSQETINQFIKHSKTPAIPATQSPSPLTPQSATLTPTTPITPTPHPSKLPWFKHPKLQPAFISASVISLILSLGLSLYLISTNSSSPYTPTSGQVLGIQDVEILLPRTASFLDGQISIGSDQGSLSFIDDQGNLYLKNSALIEGTLHTPNLQLLPSDKPNGQIGLQYVDQSTGDLMYFDGSDWITLNQSTSEDLSLQAIYDTGDTTLLAESQDINLTLGSSVATGSAASLNLTLAGPQSSFKILGGAGQELLTINDDAIYPITFSQPTQVIGNLYAPQFLDLTNSAYFLDPANTGLSLSLAGDATISSTLKFSNHNDYLTNSVKDYLIFSGGLGIGGSHDKGIDKNANLKVNEGRFSSNVGIKTDSPSEALEVNGNLKVTNGSIFVDNTELAVPDYIFNDDYQPLSPVDLADYLSLNRHLPGVPSQGEIKAQGLDLSSFALKLLERVEINTLYLLDLYQKQNQILAPTTETEVLVTNFISPLTPGQITISSPVTVQGTLTADTVKTKELISDKVISDKVITNELVATNIKASTIEGLKDKIKNLVDQYQQDPSIIDQPDPPTASVSALIADLQTPLASPSGNLELNSLNADAGFFSEYLAVLGQATITDLKVTNTLTLNQDLILASNSISTLSDTLYLQPSGQGSINFLAGLMTLDSTGQLTITGNLKVTGLADLNQVKTNTLIAKQIDTPSTQPLNINIASQSAVSLYSSIGPVASFNASGSASLQQLKLANSGTATISAGTNHVNIQADQLTPQSQVILTFNSNYAPATKYWVVKDPANHQFTPYVNYPVNQPVTLDWLIIN